MPDAEVPTTPARRTTMLQDREDPLDGFCKRMAAAGATAEQIEEVRNQWDQFDEDWTPKRQAEVRFWSTARIRRELETIDDEFVEATTTEDEEAELDLAAARQATIVDARQVIDRRIDLVLEWVGDDLLRADAIRELEAASDKPRATLLDRLPSTDG